MVAVDPDDAFKDHRGRPVLNGAGAVKKEKKVDGQVVRMQRFISNLIPSNMFQDRGDGDDKLLPYLGQLTLVEQEEREVWLVDSEDFAMLQLVQTAGLLVSAYGLRQASGCSTAGR